MDTNEVRILLSSRMTTTELGPDTWRMGLDYLVNQAADFIQALPVLVQLLALLILKIKPYWSCTCLC